MNGENRTLVVFARRPVAGQVKTRLATSIGPAAAADLYLAFLRDTLRIATLVPVERCIACSPADEATQHWFTTLADQRLTVWPQPAGELGERLAACFEKFLDHPGDRLVVIGSDAPTLPHRLIEQAFDTLDAYDAVIGPAMDGGYYLIGARQTGQGAAALFNEIDWDGPSVLEQTVTRLRESRYSLGLLPPWYDVDTLEDLQALHGHLAALEYAGDFATAPCTRQALHLLQTDMIPNAVVSKEPS
ncbi:MAG: TIGR04282 family arsenosugar biosynthesis glycosyltransferase [Planctomycetaceae bacterium]